MKKNYFLIAFILTIFSGCSVTNQVMGEHYLKEEKFTEGYKYFNKEVRSKEVADTSYYYYARFLLAQGKTKESIAYFKKALKLNPNESAYYSWIGVAYGTINNYKEEQKAYKKALELDVENIEALVYFGHSYFDQKKYELALSYYNSALRVDDENEVALFNRAKALRELKRVPEEKQAWLNFLEYYLSGFFAKKATEYLNGLGDFSYKNHTIGLANVTLSEITFTPISNELTSEAKESLDVLGYFLTKFKKTSIHIVVFQLNNKTLAKEKAKKIKEYLLDKYNALSQDRLLISWFDKPKTESIGKLKYKVNATVDFITATNKK